MSVPMELDDPATEAVPLDLTVKKENGCAAVERDGPEKDVPPPPPQPPSNGGKSTPLDLSAGRASSSQAPPTANIAQRATVVVLSPKVISSSPKAVASSPPPKPQPQPQQQPQCKAYWTPDSSSSLMPEHLAPLHGIYADAAAYRHMISSAAVPEYNPFLAVLPSSAATQFHHHDHFQHQQQQLHIQQQHQLHLQQQLQLQLQMQQQQQHHQEQQQKFQKQKLQLQAAYGGLPIVDPALLLSGSPVYGATSSPSSSESNHFPFGGFDCSFSKPPYGFGYPYYERMLDGRMAGGICGGVDISANRSDCPSPESTTTCTTTTDDHHHFNHHHHQQQQQQQQRDMDREHRHRIKACDMDDMDDLDVVDPEEVAAIYRQSDFLSFRHRYMESLGPPRNFEKMRRSNNNNNDDHRLMPGQQQYDQTYVMKRQKNNEAAKRSRDAKRQKYIENQISVMYLTKKVSEMKDIKRRLLKSM